MNRSSLPSTRLSVFADAKDLLGLAWPVVMSRLGYIALGVVDTIMVGQYAADHLAYFGIGLVPSNIVLVAQFGLLMGVQVCVANAFGAGKFRACGMLFWRAMPYAFILGLIGFVLSAFGGLFLQLLGQSDDIVVAGGEISFVIGLGLPFSCLFMVAAFFLEGVRIVRPQMMIMLGVNIANIFLNYMLVHGAWGAPEMGAVGAAWASFVVRVLQIIAILVFIFNMPQMRRYWLHRIPRPNWRAGRKMREIGYATGLSFGIENGCFNFLTIFAGYLGAVAVAAHVITFNVFVIGFMFGLGISAATSVRVGNAYGAKDLRETVRIAWIGLGMQSGFMIFFALGFLIFADELAGFYTDAVPVRLLAASLLVYAMACLTFDAAQTLISQALRARNDAWFPTYIHTFSYGFIMLPLAWISAFYWGRGAFGLMDGFIVSTLFSTSLVMWRFYWLARRDKNFKR